MIVALLNHTLIGTPGLLLPLGQSARLERATSNLWFYLPALTVLVILIAAVGLVARKYLTGPIQSSGGDAVFDLSELRQLHHEGHLSDDEYLAARSAALSEGGSFLGDAGKQADPQSDPSTRPRNRPPNRSGIHLGPELLDTPHATPEPRAESDNLDDNPPAKDIEPKD